MMSEINRDTKLSRPFYELPSHIKPCSTIIKEARMQLKQEKIKSASEFNNGSANGSSNNNGFGSIRAVSTQRPFTPRDSISLWGTSAKKRPPSAITLSRLCMDDIDENEKEQLPTSQKPIVSKQHEKISPGGITKESLEDSSWLLSSKQTNGKPKDMDETRMKLDSLSLYNNLRNESDIAMADGNEEFHNNTSNGQDGKYYNNREIVENSLGGSSRFEEEINTLDSLIGCLSSFVDSSDKPSKPHVISVLKEIKERISVIQYKPDLRRKLLKSTFKLVEKNQGDQDILFWTSFILLHCKITGNNLTTVFKMVFKASKSKEYLGVIQDTKHLYLDVLMDSLQKICPKTHIESLIYGYGTLKFICDEQNVLLRVLELDLIKVMVVHYRNLNFEVSQLKKTSVPDSIFSGVFQLTSIMRSIVDEENTLQQVAYSGLLDELCNSLVWTIDDLDVLTNIMRILSVVSAEDVCCDTIARNDLFCDAIVRVVKVWHTKEDVIVRLSYCLGNLLAKAEDIRVKLYDESDAFPLIVQLISFYIGKPGVAEDILIKCTRILANWSLSPAIGSEICDDQNLCEILNSILLQAKSISDELLFCTIAAIHNTSFYKECTTLDDITFNSAEMLYGFLCLKNLDVRSESMKVLGNLTRNSEVQRLAASHMETLLTCLEEEGCCDLQAATLGVLINVIVDEKVKTEFLHKNGIESLIRLMETTKHISLCVMISQLVWNLIMAYEMFIPIELENPSSPSFHNNNNFKSIIGEAKCMDLRRSFLRKLQIMGQEEILHEQILDDDNLPYYDYNDFETLTLSLIHKLSP